MSPAIQPPDAEELKATLYEVENVYSPLRIAVELVVLRRLLRACRACLRALPPRLQRALGSIPGLDERGKWDELARAGVSPPEFATRDNE